MTKNSQLLKKAIKAGFRIGFVDIENSPQLLYGYQLFGANISHNQIICHKQITSIAYMEDGDKKPTIVGWDDSREKDGSFNILRADRDVSLLTKAIPDLLNYDLLIGQNSDAFDYKEIQWRACLNKLPPLNNFLSLDILKMSRKTMRPTSQKLDYRSQAHGFGGKIDQTMLDCIAVAMGDRKAQKLRMVYNVKDVVDTRQVFWAEVDYYTLPKWLIRTINLFLENVAPAFCVKCAAGRQSRYDVTQTKGGSFSCNNCHYSWRKRK